MPTIDLGIVGASGRGGSFQMALDAYNDVRVSAVCDINLYDDDIEEAAAALGATETYRDYNAMLVQHDLDAVLIGTPVQHHVTQAIGALDRDIHVLSEVPTSVGIGESRDLVRAVENAEATYMMAENYVYMWSNQAVQELVDRGLFGEPYYAEGEYLHELKDLHERTPWRRVWGSDRNGITYPTHSLGPILQWWQDDRVERVTCAGSGYHHRDPRGEKYGMEDGCVMLAETERDRLIKIRFDTLSDRPHAMDNYQMQGTEGAYESARSRDEPDRIWLSDMETADRSHDYEWHDLGDVTTNYGIEPWGDAPDSAHEAGHGGGDFFVVKTFLDSIIAGEKPPIGIHEAMDMTLPGLATLESMRNDGEWVPVPDSREW